MIGLSMYDSALQKARQVRRFTIRTQGVGWEVVDADETQVRRRLLLSDWHRVERQMASIKTLEAELQRQGWRKTA